VIRRGWFLLEGIFKKICKSLVFMAVHTPIS
jgi:hypothetical protein